LRVTLYLIAAGCFLAAIAIGYAHGQERPDSVSGVWVYRLQQAEQAIGELRYAIDRINMLVVGALVALVINLILTIAGRKQPRSDSSDSGADHSG